MSIQVPIPVHRYVSSFLLYEVVEIHPIDLETEPDVVNLTGTRGVIVDLGLNDSTGHWDIYVTLQNGETWYFEDTELRGTGIILSKNALQIEGDEVHTVRVQVDPVTNAGTVVAGEVSHMRKKPAPLTIDLEKL